jgi:intergrase/recombinase
MFDILKDDTKFEQLKMLKSNIYKETVKCEDKVRKLLNELKNEELISEQQHDELTKPIGSRPGILYRP